MLTAEDRRVAERFAKDCGEVGKWPTLASHTIDWLLSHIAELEAANQWRPIEEAP